jgi:two-component system chemotaxis sensor kinase CheA
VNFEAQLVPVEDAGGLLAAAQGEDAAPIIVVICREAGRHVGIAVTHVLDVAAGRNLFEAGTGQLASGVTLLKERVTGVVGLEAMPAAAMDENAPGSGDGLVEDETFVEGVK